MAQRRKQIVTPDTGPMFEIKHMPAAQANQSAAFIFNTGAEPAFFVWGGYTKLEQGALQIAAGMAAAGYGNNADVVDRAVELAEKVLAECRRREGTTEAKPEPEEEASRVIT